MSRIIILSLTLLVLSMSSIAQNLTFDEVLSLRKKSLSEVEEYLNARGWKFLEAAEPEGFDKLGNVTFTYKKNYTNDLAESFFSYYYSDYDNNRIAVQVHKPDIYNKYLARIRSLGMKMINSEVESGNMIKIYQGKTTTVKVTISSQQEDYSDSHKTLYRFFILSNFDYNTYF